VKKAIITLAVCCVVQVTLSSVAAFALDNETIKVAEELGKSVVSISSVVRQKVGGRFYFGSPFGEFSDDPFRQFFEEFFGEGFEREYKRMGLGSGVIIDRDGYILTNEHVVAGASEVKVKLSDGRELDAQIKGIDPRSDLAVIKIEAKNLTPARLGNSDKLRIGEWVLAIGNPFGFAIENPEPTVTVGVVSALHRYLPGLGRRERGYDDLIQTDAAINPGNSGGPLVNLKGEVIGINTAIITTSGGYQGLGFAVPINKAKRILNRLIKGEKILYGWLGVNIQDLNDDLRSYFGIKEQNGVIVLRVYKNSPAEQSGLKEGDLIVAFNKQPVQTTRDLVNMVSAAEVNQRVPIQVLRAGKQITLAVRIGAMPGESEALLPSLSQRQASFRGLTVEDITSLHKNTYKLKEDEGVVIVDIQRDSPAAQSDLAVGDVISKIENKKVATVQDFKAITAEIRGSCLIKTNRGYFVLKEK